MKKFICFIAFTMMIFIGINAQTPISYSCVIQKEGATAEQIYNSLMNYIVTEFKATNNDFYHNKEQLIITKDVMFDFAPKIYYRTYDGYVKYKLKLQCRDGRFKVELVNFNHISTNFITSLLNYCFFNNYGFL